MAYRRIDDNDTVEIRRAQGGNKPETRTVAELNEYFSKEEPTITAGAPIAPVAAQAVLTLSGTLTDGDVVTVNDVTYTFKDALSTDPVAANEVLIGENEDASVTNLAAAINGDGTAGTDYSTGTEQPTDVTAVASIANDTVTCTAKTAGVAGNAYPKDATGDKLDWDGEGETFTLGANGTVGAAGALRYSDTELYVSVDESTTAVSNWLSAPLLPTLPTVIDLSDTSDEYEIEGGKNSIVVLTDNPNENGIILPAAIVGLRVTIINQDDETSVTIEPASGEHINGSANYALTLAALTSATFYCYANGYWATIYGISQNQIGNQ